jgi:hypothetical protein
LPQAFEQLLCAVGKRVTARNDDVQTAPQFSAGRKNVGGELRVA